MLGFIGFKGYRILCIIGVEPHERELEQELFIDLKVEVDFSAAVVSGELKDTIDYTALAEMCKIVAKNGKYFLIESFASEVLKMIIDQFPIKSAWIRINKPSAIPEAECAIVELRLEK